MPSVLFLITFAHSSPQQLRGILRCFYEKLFFAIAYFWEALNESGRPLKSKMFIFRDGGYLRNSLNGSSRSVFLNRNQVESTLAVWLVVGLVLFFPCASQAEPTLMLMRKSPAARSMLASRKTLIARVSNSRINRLLPSVQGRGVCRTPCSGQATRGVLGVSHKHIHLPSRHVQIRLLNRPRFRDPQQVLVQGCTFHRSPPV